MHVCVLSHFSENKGLYKHECECAKSLQLCPPLCDPMDYGLPGSFVYDKNTGVSCRTLLQGILLTQGLNPKLLCLLQWQAGSLPLSTTWIAIYKYTILLNLSQFNLRNRI